MNTYFWEISEKTKMLPSAPPGSSVRPREKHENKNSCCSTLSSHEEHPEKSCAVPTHYSFIEYSRPSASYREHSAQHIKYLHFQNFSSKSETPMAPHESVCTAHRHTQNRFHHLWNSLPGIFSGYYSARNHLCVTDCCLVIVISSLILTSLNYQSTFKHLDGTTAAVMPVMPSKHQSWGQKSTTYATGWWDQLPAFCTKTQSHHTKGKTKHSHRKDKTKGKNRLFGPEKR